MKTYQIYCITNKINGKKYIGYSKNYIKRCETHLSKKGCAILLRQAIEKYNRCNFLIEMIYESSDIEEIKQKEIYYIQEYNSFSPNGYNIAIGGTGGDTTSFNPRKEEIIEKRIKSIKERYKKYGSPLKGIKKPHRSKEYCDNISNAKLGEKNGMFGKTTSNEQKKIASEMCKKRKGKLNPNYGKSCSDRHKRKTSESMKKYWAKKKEKTIL